MDHAEEQEMEIQALEAIYDADYKRLDEPGSSDPAAFEVTLVPEAGADEDVNHVSVAMKIVYAPTYPEAPPSEISLRPVRRGALTDELIAECEELLREAAASEELLGTAMVYPLAEKCIEWLVEHNQPELDMHAQMMQRLKKEQEQQQQQQGGDDEAVDVGDGGIKGRGRKGAAAKSGEPQGSWRKDPTEAAFDGAAAAAAAGEDYTPVTPESFAEWRKEWDAQRAAAKAEKSGTSGKAKSTGNIDAATVGLSGRMLFAEGGASLIGTDAGALEEGEEDVMSAPRAAVDDADAGGDASGGDGGASGAVAAADVLADVGDADLFDDEEDLPSDEDDEE